MVRFRLAGKEKPAAVRPDCPTGKSLRRLRKRPVQPFRKKYFASPVGQISDLSPRVSPKKRGGSRSSRTCGGMRWTRKATTDERGFGGRRSRVVLAPRCWRQVREK